MPNNKILSLRPIQFVSAGVLKIFNADVYTAMSALLRRAIVKLYVCGVSLSVETLNGTVSIATTRACVCV